MTRLIVFIACIAVLVGAGVSVPAGMAVGAIAFAAGVAYIAMQVVGAATRPSR